MTDPDPVLLELSTSFAIAFATKDRAHLVAFVEALQSAIDSGYRIMPPAEFVGRRIVARREGYCRSCKSHLPVGDVIVWSRAAGTMCVVCAPEAP